MLRACLLTLLGTHLNITALPIDQLDPTTQFHVDEAALAISHARSLLEGHALTPDSAIQPDQSSDLTALVDSLAAKIDGAEDTPAYRKLLSEGTSVLNEAIAKAQAPANLPEAMMLAELNLERLSKSFEEVASKMSMDAPSKYPEPGTKLVMLTTFTHPYAGMTNNLLCSAKRFELPVLVVSLEAEGCKLMVEDFKKGCVEVSTAHGQSGKLAAVRADAVAVSNASAAEESKAGGGGGEYGTAGFREVAQTKPQLSEALRRLGYHVLFIDSDIVFKRNPIEELGEEAYKAGGSVDMLVQQETRADFFRNGLNSGFYQLFHGEGGKALMAAWLASIQNDPAKGAGDQVHLDSIRNQFSLRTLPAETFPNGMAYFQPNEASEKANEDPVIVHNNFIRGGSAKVKRFKEHGLWFVTDDNSRCVV